jgi:co-chaperonin GroES (HSP10)
MFQAGFNNVFVKVKTKYIGNFTEVMRMSAIQQGATIEPMDYCNIIGEVVSIPIGITNKRDHKGYSVSDVQVGDMAIFSYQVIGTTVQKEPKADPIFKNSVWYKGEEYWAVDITNLFATIRNGQIRMQNGYVMLEQMAKPSVIILSQETAKLNSAATAIVSNIAKNWLVVEQFDRVYYNPNKIQLYQINGKPFGIIRQKDILGKEIPSYKEIAALN